MNYGNLFVEREKDLSGAFMLIWFIYAESEYGIDDSKNWLKNNYQFITENIDRLTIGHTKNLINKKKYEFEQLSNEVPDLIDTIIKKWIILN